MVELYTSCFGKVKRCSRNFATEGKVKLANGAARCCPSPGLYLQVEAAEEAQLRYTGCLQVYRGVIKGETLI